MVVKRDQVLDLAFPLEVVAAPYSRAIALYPVDADMKVVEGAAPVGSLHLSVGEGGRAVLKGVLNGHSIEAELQRQNAADMPLMSRGFHWISEAPYFHMFASEKD